MACSCSKNKTTKTPSKRIITSSTPKRPLGESGRTRRANRRIIR